ncbi:MAG: hypothetical protein IKH22_05480, partial [Prevotella sp.]|nr:hypothetical protein [Prevotella sp.]
MTPRNSRRPGPKAQPPASVLPILPAFSDISFPSVLSLSSPNKKYLMPLKMPITYMNTVKSTNIKNAITQLSQVDVVQELQEFWSSDNTSNPCKLTQREPSALSS